MSNVSERYAHLVTLQGPYGTFEHAEYEVPRREHGYCCDDVSRVLVLTSRELETSPLVEELESSSLEFLLEAQDGTGRIRNRRSEFGEWLGPYSTEDCWGRTLWALGTATARSQSANVRTRAAASFNRGCQSRSKFPRATAFSVLGADEVLRVDPDNALAAQLMVDAQSVLQRSAISDNWRWSEPRLTYANAVLPEAMLAIGTHVGDARLVQEALNQLGWLVACETRDGHLSVTAAGGRGPFEKPRQFDQQPIEVATLADACVRAYRVTGEQRWIDTLSLAIQWFDGENDGGFLMWNPTTGGGYDGLCARGPNVNQGAESTLALLTTRQHQMQMLQHSP